MKSSASPKILKKAGWVEVRQTACNEILRHPDHKEPISLPFHGSKEVGTGLAEKLKKQAGL